MKKIIVILGLLALPVLSACQQAKAPAPVEQTPQASNVPFSKGPSSAPDVKGPSTPPPATESSPQAVTKDENIKLTLPYQS